MSERLSREQIEDWRIAWLNDSLKPEVFSQLNTLCDMALASLPDAGEGEPDCVTYEEYSKVLARLAASEARVRELEEVRDLAIEGSRKQMIRAEALQDKLDKSERDLDAVACPHSH